MICGSYNELALLKQEGLAPLVTDPPGANSRPLKNPPSPLSIAVTFELIIQF